MTIRQDDLDAEDAGRVRYHAEHGNMGPLLRVTGVTTRMNIDDQFAEAGITTPTELVEHYDEYGHFKAVESIGARSSALLEEVIPLIRLTLKIPEPETDVERMKRRVERRKRQRAKQREQTLRELTDEPPSKARQVSLFDVGSGGGE